MGFITPTTRKYRKEVSVHVFQKLLVVHQSRIVLTPFGGSLLSINNTLVTRFIWNLEDRRAVCINRSEAGVIATES